MPERPPLVFPTPQAESRTRLQQNPGLKGIRLPDRERQFQRLSPKFDQLLRSMSEPGLEVLNNPSVGDPEQVLVLETVGSVERFANAVRRVEGLDWLGEVESDEIVPDEDFYDESDPSKSLSGRLYLLITNQRALQEVLSLWRRYVDDPGFSFPYGLTTIREVFIRLKNVRRWNVTDRLLETGAMDDWIRDLKEFGNRPVRFEVEMWFRDGTGRRSSREMVVTDLIRKEGGRVLAQSVIEEIAYHGLLAELPAMSIQNIVDSQETELVKCEDIMFIRSAGQVVFGDRLTEGDISAHVEETFPQPTGEPTVALFDGVPLANHSLLAGRLILDDPEDWESDYPALERIHGTAMASLIAHGDLNKPGAPLGRPIYVRPIMRPRGSLSDSRPEGIPDDRLVVDLIHEAVRRLFEAVQGDGPAAPHVKVVNLSIGDPSRQFTQEMSPLARLLDWLSVKYNVLFVVSAGTHSRPLSLEVSREEFESWSSSELEDATIKALFRDARHRKILAPAETMNGLCVGAVHEDNGSPASCRREDDRIDPFPSRLLPSPISAFGSGYRRALKPDLVFAGGRQYYRRVPGADPVILEPVATRAAPGNSVACPSPQPGQLRSTTFSRGTSDAAALISRAAGFCYDSMLQVFSEGNADSETSNYVDSSDCEAQILKSMLVHGCSWDKMGGHLQKVLKSQRHSRQARDWTALWIGYGIPEWDRVIDCAEGRATVFGCGKLGNDEAHVYQLPLPPSLGSRSDKRRLTVTLAWFSPISASTQKYRTASLWFELIGNNLAPHRANADWQAVKRGTVQHEVFEGSKAQPFLDGEKIKLKINCREDAGNLHAPVGYGLAVSLEVAEGAGIAVYDEIRTRIAPSLPIRPETAG